MKLNKLNIGLLSCTMALFTIGCKPVKVLDIVEIKPNDTAWAIPLDAMSKDGQVKFNSVDFLNQKKVSAKRIMVDKIEYKTGRFYWDIQWIPVTRVITVDRSLVTKEWIDKEDIGVVTKDSVQLRVGLTITASIDEDLASTYLYYHGARPLADVINQNVRSFAVAELTREYSELSLAEAQTQGTRIYNDLFQHAKEAFKAKGIEIQFLGNADGLEYADPKVQESINLSYKASQDAKTAEMEQSAQKIRNSTLILTAQAQAEAAQKLFAAKEASSFNNDLQIRLLEAQAKMKMASNWNGALPANIIPGDSPILMNLGTANATK
jgi:hypothetical protein